MDQKTVQTKMAPCKQKTIGVMQLCKQMIKCNTVGQYVGYNRRQIFENGQ